jgi:hypothetical protein
MRSNKRATSVSLKLRETPELRAHIAEASPTSPPPLASQPIDTPEAIPPDQREAVTLAADLCGVKTRAAANVVLGEVVSLLSWSQSQETGDNLHTAIALLGELGPTNAPEALLNAQMIGTHQAATQFLMRPLAPEQTVEGTETNANRAMRLMRLFIEHLEAMTKLKGKGGQQRVVVEHVTWRPAVRRSWGRDTRGEGDGTPKSFRSCESDPLNLFRSQSPTPSTR